MSAAVASPVPEPDFEELTPEQEAGFAAYRQRRRVVDPHHPIIANGITVAIVPCTSDCPPHHFYRDSRKRS